MPKISRVTSGTCIMTYYVLYLYTWYYDMFADFAKKAKSWTKNTWLLHITKPNEREGYTSRDPIVIWHSYGKSACFKVNIIYSTFLWSIFHSKSLNNQSSQRIHTYIYIYIMCVFLCILYFIYIISQYYIVRYPHDLISTVLP